MAYIMRTPIHSSLVADTKIEEHRSFFTHKLRVRDYSYKDQNYVCSWVKSREDLLKVSGDSSDFLTPNILFTWISKAQISLVVSREPIDDPIGFCTLSRLEVDNIPASYIEICHLIIDPKYRYMYIGPRLVREAISVSRSLKIQFVCGRVAHSNRYGLILARKQMFEEFTDSEVWTPTGFQWFRYNLSATSNNKHTPFTPCARIKNG